MASSTGIPINSPYIAYQYYSKYIQVIVYSAVSLNTEEGTPR